MEVAVDFPYGTDDGSKIQLEAPCARLKPLRMCQVSTMLEALSILKVKAANRSQTPAVAIPAQCGSPAAGMLAWLQVPGCTADLEAIGKPYCCVKRICPIHMKVSPARQAGC
jgi:hypothetical protein